MERLQYGTLYFRSGCHGALLHSISQDFQSLDLHHRIRRRPRSRHHQ